VLNHNAPRVDIRLDSVDDIVLSHGHYDHTGGLAGVLSLARQPRVYAHRQAFEPKYAQNPDGTGRNVGMAESAKEAVRAKARLQWTDGPMEIAEGLWCTGAIPRTNDYEDTGGAFFKDESCREPDMLPDDQAVFLITRAGTVVILGCAHAGVINTLHYIRTLTENCPIHAVVGGMHLLHASLRRMEITVAELRRLGVNRLMPCHCTGFAARARLWHEFPGFYEDIHVGTVIAFEV
jgi:7,8-dihydropterin-6-yl-methyl-4-(beta-D-ribofuranosyl)aminobenzene 5'-phosphate synthase